VPQKLLTSSITCSRRLPRAGGATDHRFVRTLRIRQALGLNNPTAATTSPSRDANYGNAGTRERVFINFGGPSGPMETGTSACATPVEAIMAITSGTADRSAYIRKSMAADAERTPAWWIPPFFGFV